jgi:hypothetical protein
MNETSQLHLFRLWQTAFHTLRGYYSNSSPRASLQRVFVWPKRLYTQRLLSLLRTAPLYTSGTLTCPRAPSERASTTAHAAPSEPPRIRTVPAKQHSPWSSNISAVNKSSPHAWQKSHHIERPKLASRAGRGIKLPKAVFPNIWLSQSSLCY